MPYFLAKTDPDTYSIDDFEREKKAVWDGVTNPQAVRTIRSMRPGDRVFVYHSGGVSGIVGLASVESEPARDYRAQSVRSIGVECVSPAGSQQEKISVGKWDRLDVIGEFEHSIAVQNQPKSGMQTRFGRRSPTNVYLNASVKGSLDLNRAQQIGNGIQRLSTFCVRNAFGRSDRICGLTINAVFCPRTSIAV